MHIIVSYKTHETRYEWFIALTPFVSALLTEMYLYPSTEIAPARNPTIMEPNGVSIISPAVPTATPPANAAF